MHKRNLLILTVFLSSHCPASDDSALQFHVVSPDGKGRIAANIAPEGIRQDGTIISDHHPNSIIYQHRKMMQELAQEDAALKLELEEETEQMTGSPGFFNESRSLLNSGQKNVPGNIFLNNRASKTVLQELIELEKRAGRVKPEE